MNRLTRMSLAALAAGSLTIGMAPTANAYSVRSCTIDGVARFTVSTWTTSGGWRVFHYKGTPTYRKVVKTGPDFVWKWSQARVVSPLLRNNASDGYFRVKGSSARTLEGRWYTHWGPFDGYKTCKVKLP